MKQDNIHGPPFVTCIHSKMWPDVLLNVYEIYYIFYWFKKAGVLECAVWVFFYSSFYEECRTNKIPVVYAKYLFAVGNNTKPN